ncbi:MAG: aquaporin [Cyanobacteria bacterium TGS_CYA1]|nr:aquaporin [Cyanobacteria bacterium TGS_CYA1]
MTKKLVSEFLGTAFLLATVIGSGLLVNNIDASNQSVNLLCVAIAVGGMLYALITMFEAHSNHFNPVVTLLTVAQGNMSWKWVMPYVLVQITGAITGVVAANLMFELAPVSIATAARTGYGQWIAELFATFGLIGIIMTTAKHKPSVGPQAVVLYIVGAIFATSSTCFANPAVTIARIFTESGAGIRACDVPAFVAFQFIGGIAAMLLFGWLNESKVKEKSAKEAEIVPILPLPTQREFSSALN